MATEVDDRSFPYQSALFASDAGSFVPADPSVIVLIVVASWMTIRIKIEGKEQRAE
jgi:hypothetical protein